MIAEQTTFSFRLPIHDGRLELEAIGHLLRSIPAGWAYMNGRLYAPRTLVEHREDEAPKIACRTQLQWQNQQAPRYLGIAFEKDSDEFVSGSNPHWCEPELSVYRSFDALPPRLLWFIYAGYAHSRFDATATYQLSAATNFAYDYILNRHYHGHLELIARVGDYSDQIAAQVCICFKVPYGAEGWWDQYPPHVRVMYNPRYRGTRADIESILAVCRDLQLCSYEPLPDPQTKLDI